MSGGVLEGVKVLDLSEDIAGSFCARLLADYGAEVLKLEPPSGASLRRIGPFFQDDPHQEKSLLFLALDLNKKGITLSLDTFTGRSILTQLVRDADVVVESFRPGHLESLGLDYQSLEQIKPSLVMTSITPFGQDGPYSQYHGEEIVSYAMSMIMSISGLQGQEPLKHGGFQAQYEAGLNAAAATSMALLWQTTTGLGRHIDVSVTECVASTMVGAQSMYAFTGGVPARPASATGLGHPVPCADGWVMLQEGGGASWDDLAEFLHAPALLQPKFADPGQRVRFAEELGQIVAEAVKNRGRWELFTEASRRRVLVGVVQTPEELVKCPQLESRQFFQEIDHPMMGRIKVPAVLFNLSLTPYQLQLPAPTLGQHNQEIYRQRLSYTREELCRLRAARVI